MFIFDMEKFNISSILTLRLKFKITDNYDMINVNSQQFNRVNCLFC